MLNFSQTYYINYKIFILSSDTNNTQFFFYFLHDENFYLYFNLKRDKLVYVLYLFLETGTSDRTSKGLDQVLKCLGFSLYPI